MGFAPENQVRTGLPAGGRRIRTLGPPLKKDPPRRDVRPLQHFLAERDRGFESVFLQRRVLWELRRRDAMGRAARYGNFVAASKIDDAPAERLEQVPRPVRVSSETLPRSRRACMRYPSSLISMQPFHALRRRIDQFAELWLDPSWRLDDWPRGTLVVDVAITAWGSSPPHEIPSEMLD